jgi:hypothetical protein
VWASFAGQAGFVASWLIAGAAQPHYSHLEQSISELAARTAAHPWIETTGVVLLAAAVAALAGALALVLPRRRGLPVALFAGAAAVFLVLAFTRLDCAPTVDARCHALQDAGALSTGHYVHAWSSLLADLFLLATPFALAYALWPGTAAAQVLACGGFGLAIAAVTIPTWFVDGTADGLVQRADLAVLHLWLVLVGGGVLWATRAGPRTSPLIPMRPREFLSRSWTGDGELVLRPFFLGRFFRQTVEARRQSVWISESVWRIEDEAHFGRGRFERRSMYAEFVSDSHVRLTADDLIDGADVWLEPDGFRLSEWRMAWPIGPLPLIVRCVDRSRFEPDGTFVNTIDVYSLGPRIPIARVTFRMRSSQAAVPPREERWELDPA